VGKARTKAGRIAIREPQKIFAILMNEEEWPITILSYIEFSHGLTIG
jgi:hypothetical protein